jgi:hypothetical protein
LCWEFNKFSILMGKVLLFEWKERTFFFSLT